MLRADGADPRRQGSWATRPSVSVYMLHVTRVILACAQSSTEASSFLLEHRHRMDDAYLP